MAKLILISSIGGLLFGYDTGVVSGAILYLKNDWPNITNQQQELIVSIALLGAFISSLVSGPLSDKYGRRIIIILSDAFFTIGAILMAVSASVEVLMVGRFIIGLGIGIASLIVPIYLSEICPKEVRGQVVAICTVFITVG